MPILSDDIFSGIQICVKALLEMLSTELPNEVSSARTPDRNALPFRQVITYRRSCCYQYSCFRQHSCFFAQKYCFFSAHSMVVSAPAFLRGRQHRQRQSIGALRTNAILQDLTFSAHISVFLSQCLPPASHLVVRITLLAA